MDLVFQPGATAALPYISYDQYILGGVVYGEEGIPLAQFKGIKQFGLTLKAGGIAMGNFGNFTSLPGETDFTKEYDIAMEEAKAVAQDLVMSLHINEALGACFEEEFTEDNILVTSLQKVKFRNLTQLKGLNHAQWEAKQRSNYDCAKAIIQGFFPANHIPPSIQCLLNLMDDFGCRSFYHLHPSLVPLPSSAAFFFRIYEEVRFKVPIAQFHAIIENIPYMDTWAYEISSNEVLMETYNFNVSSYAVPQVSPPNQHNLTKMEKTLLKKIKVDPTTSGKTGLSQIDVIRIKGVQFLDYLRHRFAHRMEALDKYIIKSSNQQNPAPPAPPAPRAPEDAEMVAQVRFPEAVHYLMMQLHQIGWLAKIPLSSFFLHYRS